MKRQIGITLVELMVALALVGILMVVAVPRLQRTIESSRMVAGLNALAGALSLASTEATKQRRTVTLCASSDGVGCTNSTWGDGWIVFTDFDENGKIDAANGDTLLSIGAAVPKGLTLSSRIFDSQQMIQVRRNGFIRGLAGDGTNRGSFYVCGSDVDPKKAYAINVNGHASSDRAMDTAPGNGIVNLIDGSELTCP